MTARSIEKLNNEINAALADPKIKARLATLGGTVLALSPAEFGKLIADETEKWGKVIRAANIKAESAVIVAPTFHKSRSANETADLSWPCFGRAFFFDRTEL